mgnify:CR=1 FL=1
MQHHNEPDELPGTPFLRSLPRTDPFVVPDGFFNQFPHAVQRRAIAATRAPRQGWPFFGPTHTARLISGGLTALAVALVTWVFWPASPAGPSVTDMPWTSGDLLHEGTDVELLYTELHPDLALMDIVVLPEDNEAVLAYLENQNLPLDLLIEQP